MQKLVVLFCIIALAAAKPSFIAPYAYSAVVSPGVSSVSQYSNSVVHGSPLYTGYAPLAHAVYPVAQAPGSPAVVLDAVHGVPLDTPEVVAARAAHYQAKALSGVHVINKRSVAVAPLAYSSVVSPLAYSSPYVSAYSSPYIPAYGAHLVSPYSYVPKALSVHPW